MRVNLPHLVEPSSDINRALLNDIVNYLRERGQEIGRIDLWVEENLGREEPLISHIDTIFLI